MTCGAVRVRLAVCSNLGVFAAQERLAGRRDSVDKMGEAALLTQPNTLSAEARLNVIAKDLLRKWRLAELKSALGTVPLGLLTWLHLLIYLALTPYCRKSPLVPVPPVETFWPNRS